MPSLVSDRFTVCPFQFLPVAKHHGFCAVSLLHILRLVRKDQPRTLCCSGTGTCVLPRIMFYVKNLLRDVQRINCTEKVASCIFKKLLFALFSNNCFWTITPFGSHRVMYVKRLKRKVWISNPYLQHWFCCFSITSGWALTRTVCWCWCPTIPCSTSSSPLSSSSAPPTRFTPSPPSSCLTLSRLVWKISL